jgi:F0F1-type ATP synthase alpha subunit
LLGHVVDALRAPIDGKGVLNVVEWRCVKVKAPRIIARMSWRVVSWHIVS